MATWRCPHCGTPQAETSRCWACSRSATSCGTCRDFRRAVIGRTGYCGLDRDRAPLRGDEMRGCWKGEAVTLAAGGLFDLLPLAPRAAPFETTPTPGPAAGPKAADRRLIDAPAVVPLRGRRP